MQARTDRDDYVRIMWDNVKRGKKNHNFWKKNSEEDSREVDQYDVPYDPYSIMHYSFKAFAIDRSKPTIKSRVNFLELLLF